MKHVYEQMVFKDWDEGDRLYFTDPLSFAIATNADVPILVFLFLVILLLAVEGYVQYQICRGRRIRIT